MSVRVLSVLVGAEFLVVIVLGAVIAIKGGDFGGTSSLSLQPFTPGALFAGSLPIALLFCFASFVGFEATAIYSTVRIHGPSSPVINWHAISNRTVQVEPPRRQEPRMTLAEGLGDAAKHSRASGVRVSADTDGVNLSLEVQVGPRHD